MSRRAQGAGSVYLRKDGRYAAATMYEGKRITKYGKTKKEAWDNLQATLDDLKAGRIIVGPKQTIEQYLTHWLENVRRLRIRNSTLDEYRTVLRAHLLPMFGHFRLDQLTSECVQSFYAKLVDGGLSAGRVKTIHMVLHTALKDAVNSELLARNVCDYVTLPRSRKRKPNVLTKEECQRLVATACGCRLWFLILMGITTGARIGELLALRWDDLDLKESRVHIHKTVVWVNHVGYVEHDPKTDSGSRRVLLSQAVVDGIPAHKRYIEGIRCRAGSRWQEMSLVFPNTRGSYMNDGTVLVELKRVLVKAGLPIMRFHDLRHSAATLLFAAGVNAKVVQETLGHSNIAITLGLYGDVLPDMQREVVDVMNRVFDGS